MRKTLTLLSDAACGIAQRKIALDNQARAAQGGRTDVKSRISTGGGFSGFFLWDTAFCCRWAALTKPGEFPAASSLDCLYSFAEKDGYICREYTADGEPMFTKFAYGKGKVVYVNFGMDQDAVGRSTAFTGKHPEPYYLIYKIAAEIAGVRFFGSGV